MSSLTGTSHLNTGKDICGEKKPSVKESEKEQDPSSTCKYVQRFLCNLADKPTNAGENITSSAADVITMKM